VGRHFPKPTRRPNQPYRPSGPRGTAAKPPTLLPLCFSFADRWGHLVSHHTLIPLTFFLPTTSACSPGRARTRALDGMVACPAGPDAESPRACGLVPAEGDFTHLPRAALSRAWPARRRRVPTRPPGRSNRGQDEAFASPHAPPWYKSGRGTKPQVPKPPTPLGFSLLSSPVSVP
jgi:hypothetical protein